jgi:hypothetical protein
MMTRRWQTSLLAVALSTPTAGIPKQIEIKELGPRSVPTDILRCERTLSYKGKTLPCDSPIAADGEGLRMLLKDDPSSLKSLERYQAGRRSLNRTSYTGMLGALVMIFGPRFTTLPATRNLVVSSGLALTLGSFAYGKIRLQSNERHLDQAIDAFNRAHPDDPILLNRGP